MEENKIFYIETDGKQVKATVLTNFELYGDNYCVYTISNTDNKTNNAYCAKILDNRLIPIENEEELKLTNKIVSELINQN